MTEDTEQPDIPAEDQASSVLAHEQLSWSVGTDSDADSATDSGADPPDAEPDADPPDADQGAADDADAEQATDRNDSPADDVPAEDDQVAEEVRTDEKSEPDDALESSETPEEPELDLEEAETRPEPPRPLRTGPRPERRDFIPLWVWGVVVAILALVALGIGVSLAVNRSVTREVPNVTGLDSDVARTRLRTAGFEFVTGDRRFSTSPAGTVLEQAPRAGSLARRGSTVSVVVSAGTEEFKLPDLVGDGIVLARGILEAKGLEVKVNTQASDRPKDTVLSTNPSAGSVVHTGDIVIVTVAAPETVNSEIVPYRFEKSLFVIDPSKPTRGLDVPLDVARRLRSLLEASGGTVVVTRTLSDANTSVANRAKRTADTSATAIVGLDVAAAGNGGFIVSTPSGLAAARRVPTARLAKNLLSALTTRGSAARKGTFAADALVKATIAPLARVSLGSSAKREDAASFSDPTWADQAARAIYRALGETYGTQQP